MNCNFKNKYIRIRRNSAGFIIGLLFITLAGSSTFPPLALGLSKPADPVVVAQSPTAPADGTSSIVLQISQIKHSCASNQSGDSYFPVPQTCDDGSSSTIQPVNGYFYVSVTGTDNELEFSQPCSNSLTICGVLDEQGTATVHIRSTIAEVKEVSVSQTGPDGAWAIHSTPIEVTFTPPEDSSTEQHGSDDTNTSLGDEEHGMPAPPYIDSIIRGDLMLENSGDLVFAQGDDFTIGGSTSPGATVKLYIFSTPSEATVVAGEDGRWTYTVSGLELGAHHIEAEVTDQEGYSSERSTIMSFAITAEPTLSNVEKHVMNDTKSASRIVYIVLGIVVLVMGVVAFLMRKRLATLLASLRTKMDPAVKRLQTLVHFKKKL